MSLFEELDNCQLLVVLFKTSAISTKPSCTSAQMSSFRPVASNGGTNTDPGSFKQRVGAETCYPLIIWKSYLGENLGRTLDAFPNVRVGVWRRDQSFVTALSMKKLSDGTIQQKITKYSILNLERLSI